MLPVVLFFYVASLATNCWTLTLNKAAIENDILVFSQELEASWLAGQIKPCDDFFGHVCSRSLNATIPFQYERQMQQEQIKFKAFLESSNDEELLDSELKLKQFYNSCRNSRSMEQLKTSLMYRSVGGWPVIDSSLPLVRKRHNLTWLQVLAVFHETGIPYFFNTKIELISNKRIVKMQPDDTLRFTLRKFEQVAGEIMHSFDVDVGRARQVALEILNFERISRDITKVPVGEREKLQEFSYADFKSLSLGSVSALDWDGYFRKIMGKPLKPTDLIVVAELPRLVQYFELLHNTTLTRFLNWLWIDYLMDKTIDDCKKLTDIYFAPVYQHIVERAGIDKIQMAYMYTALGQQYEQILVHTPWIDEITHQNSKLFLEHIMHLTLNGDAKLDSGYQLLTITQKNFYRNLEKLQKFKAQHMQLDKGDNKPLTSRAMHVKQSAREFMKVFATINAIIPQQQNLTAPLNYMLLGEYFAEKMIGGAYNTAGAWRSMESDKQFEEFQACLQREQSTINRNFDLNNLLLKILAQKQAWQAYQLWLQQDTELAKSLNGLLAAGGLHLNMDKLFFIAASLADCHLQAAEQRKQFLNTVLKHSLDFQQTFKCQKGDALFSDSKCSVLKEN